MEGNDQVRFCGRCELNVYNLSELSRQEADELTRSKEGRLCVQFYERADGTRLTHDCPFGLDATLRPYIRARRGKVLYR